MFPLNFTFVSRIAHGLMVVVTSARLISVVQRPERKNNGGKAVILDD